MRQIKSRKGKGILLKDEKNKYISCRSHATHFCNKNFRLEITNTLLERQDYVACKLL